MPCDTVRKPRQSIQERAADIRRAMERVADALAKGRAKAVVGRQGAIYFAGLSTEDRDGMTDACIYRRIMATGSALARSAIMRAELVAGRTVDRQVVGQGVHSHDGGATWHPKG